MNEDVLATTILRYETEPFFDVVPFNRTETFLCRSRSWPWRGGTRRRTPVPHFGRGVRWAVFHLGWNTVGRGQPR